MAVDAISLTDLAAAHAELADQLDAAAASVLSSGYYIGGPEVEAFEAEFAAYIGVKHAIGVNSGTDAVTLALRAVGVGKGDEVITVGNTFVGSVSGAFQLGASVRLVDAEEDSCLMDVSAVAAAMTPATKAILAVHLYGQCVDMTALARLAEEAGVALVEDVAQAHGARCGERRAGACSAISAFSFYPSKNLGACGDGGAICTDSAELAAACRSWRTWGASSKYVFTSTGFNSRLDAMQAALLRVKLRVLDDWNARRQRLALRYSAALAGVAELQLPTCVPHSSHVWHLYVIRTRRRDALAAFLAERQIATGVHYPVPLAKQPAFPSLAEQLESLPVCSLLSQTILSLPMYPQLSEEAQDRVIAAILAFFAADERSGVGGEEDG